MNVPDPGADEFFQTIITKTKSAFPDAVQEVIHFLDELTVVLSRESVVDVCEFLRDDPQLGFNVLCDLCAVDMWPEVPRFEINLHLLQLSERRQPAQGTNRLRVKVRLEQPDASMPTLTGVWPSAAWYERETYELFGISFEGHPDPRPLLLPDDWEGPPPLRRDVPVHVEEVAFSFNQERIYRQKSFAKE
jgi:NADH-quinone oxidoreductase subunit C